MGSPPVFRVDNPNLGGQPAKCDRGRGDHGELLDVQSAVPFRPGKPTFVIAHTHKGHPISFMSNNVAWHHRVPDTAEFQQALTELEAAGRPRFTAQFPDGEPV